MTSAVSFAAPLVDVRLGRRGGNWPIIILIPMMVIGLGFLMPLAFRLGLPRRAVPVAAGLFFLAVILSVMSLGTRNVRRRVRRLIAEHSADDTASLVRAVGNMNHFGRVVPLSELTRELAASGRADLAIRAVRDKDVSPIEPIEVVFEPRVLVESDPTFHELATACSTPAPPATSPSTTESSRQDDPGPSYWHSMKRNVSLRGGWILLIVFLPRLVSSIQEAYQLERVTISLLWWLAFYAILLFLPIRRTRNPLESKEWYLLPGGLLVRKGRGGATTSELHVFDRRRGVLCAHHLGRQRWMLFVADPGAFEKTICTEREAQFALRSWLSSLTPPTVEQLQDWK